MQIQVNTDKTVECHAPLVTHVETVVRDSLTRVDGGISRVEVHLSALNDHKHKGGEHRCLMEARMARHPPFAASDHAESLHQAIQGAADKLKRAIDSAIGRIDDSAKYGAAVLDTEIEPKALDSGEE